MKLLYLSLSYFAIFLLDFYLKSNISAIGEGSLALPILFLFLFLGIFQFIWQACISRLLLIRHSFWVLLLFFVYFVFRTVFDKCSIDSLKAYTVATSGGVILFYVLGTFVSIISRRHLENAKLSKNYFKYFTIYLIIYIILSYGLLLNIFFELSPRIRTDILLISDTGGAYQRPGNFLIISYLMLITLYAQFIALRPACPPLVIRLAGIIIFTLFIVYTLTSILIAQMIGTNNATVTIALLCFFVLTVLILLWSKSFRDYLSNKPLILPRIIFGKVAKRFVAMGLLGLVVLVCSITSIISYFNIDLSLMRIGGFGSGELTSLNSRIELLKNFSTQFNYSPLFGNMEVDRLTTGSGTYVHSLVATLLTNTGFIGFFLFFTYLFMGYKERLKLEISKCNEFVLINNIYNLILLIFISAVIMIAVLATSFVSATLWFALGFFIVNIDFNNKYYKK